MRAQGFGPATPGAPSSRRMAREIHRMGTLQIDSVNVFARSHYLPLFSRLGDYDTARLDRLLFARHAPFVEFWAHQASFIPVEDWPLFDFRMRANRDRHERTGWFGVDRPTVEWVRAELRDRGPLRPAQIEDDAAKARRGPWWDWSAVKRALEYLWFTGDVAIAGRRGFERVYGLSEHVLPPHVLGRALPKDEAMRRLVTKAARAYGVATLADLDDYWRLREQRTVARVVRELEDEGVLVPVRVEGWERGGRPIPAWLHRDAVVPRAVDVQALLTPFDPVVWFRDRAERLFDFAYRIEIYTPAARRRFGYYSLPVLLGDDVVGRVDLKADRAGSVLRVQSAWWEEGRPAGAPASVAALLRRAAEWQGLADVTVSRWGDATDGIAAELGARRHRAGAEPVAPPDDAVL